MSMEYWMCSARKGFHSQCELSRIDGSIELSLGFRVLKL